MQGLVYISYRPESTPWSFLEVLYNSSIILLKNQSYLFIQEGESPIKILSNESNGNQILIDLFGDCELVSNKSKKVNISERSVLHLLQDYEECMKLGPEFYLEKIRATLFTGAGFARLSFAPSQTDLKYLEGKYNSKYSLSATILISLNLYTNIKKRLSLGAYSGLQYASTQFSGNHETTISNGVIYSNIITDYTEVCIPAGFQITLEKGSIFKAP